jgi:hypothetical protein
MSLWTGKWLVGRINGLDKIYGQQGKIQACRSICEEYTYRHRIFTQFIPVFSEDVAGKETLQTAGTGVVCLLPVFTLLGAFSVLGVTARVIGPGDKGLPGESEVRAFGGAGLPGGEVGLLAENV